MQLQQQVQDLQAAKISLTQELHLAKVQEMQAWLGQALGFTYQRC